MSVINVKKLTSSQFSTLSAKWLGCMALHLVEFYCGLNAIYSMVKPDWRGV